MDPADWRPKAHRSPRDNRSPAASEGRGRGPDLAVPVGEWDAGAGVGRPHFTSATLMSVEVIFCHASEALIRHGARFESGVPRRRHRIVFI